jgi:50S ribosomal subunit-associated GTPase HflX
VVNDILDKIGAKQKRINVFNKIDLIDKQQLAELKKHYSDPNNVRISVQNKDWLDDVKIAIWKNL